MLQYNAISFNDTKNKVFDTVDHNGIFPKFCYNKTSKKI